MSKLIKWSGSKDSQSEKILNYFPDNIEKYYEPFIGGGSIFLKLIEKRKNIKEYNISDINEDLINIYKLIKDYPQQIIDSYKEHYDQFNCSDEKQRKEYFYKIRDRYNQEKSASDFYWIMRTTTNGMPRYNRNGEFNNSCHFTRPGMKPESVENIILKYSELFNNVIVNFNTNSYENIKDDGFMYLDPPYENTKGMYYQGFNNSDFLLWLNNLKSNWILSYDGKVNEETQSHVAPNFKRHIYLESGNSSFRRILTGDKNSTIHESIYMNF
jgi:DNA adenine methylase